MQYVKRKKISTFVPRAPDVSSLLFLLMLLGLFFLIMFFLTSLNNFQRRWHIGRRSVLRLIDEHFSRGNSNILNADRPTGRFADLDEGCEL